MANSNRSVLPLAVAMALGCMVGVILTTALREKSPRPSRAQPRHATPSTALSDAVRNLVAAVRDLRHAKAGEAAVDQGAATKLAGTESATVPGADATTRPVPVGASPPARATLGADAAQVPQTRGDLLQFATGPASSQADFTKFVFLPAAELLRRFGPPDSHSLNRGRPVWVYRLKSGENHHAVNFTLIDWVVAHVERY